METVFEVSYIVQSLAAHTLQL